MVFKKNNNANKRYFSIIFLFLLIAFSLLGWFLYLNLKYNASDRYSSLDQHITTTLVKSVVWYHSRGKLEELRAIFMDPHYILDVDGTKMKIKNMLKHRTAIYIREFNRYQCPIDNLGNWYQDNFNFDQFLEDVFEVVFDSTLYTKETDEHIIIELKIKKIRDIMEKYQNETSELLYEKMHKKGSVKHD